MTTMQRPPSLLQEMTGAAWATSQAFDAAFELSFWLASKQPHRDHRETRLYAICEETGSAWKFGVSDDPMKRLNGLQVGNPRRLVLYAHAPARLWMEAFVHHVLRRHRLQGEWFDASPRTLSVAHLIEVAHEQTFDVAEILREGEALNSGDTLMALCFQLESGAVVIPGLSRMTPLLHTPTRRRTR
jgi:hypothetical protein